MFKTYAIVVKMNASHKNIRSSFVKKSLIAQSTQNAITPYTANTHTRLPNTGCKTYRRPNFITVAPSTSKILPIAQHVGKPMAYANTQR